MLIDATKKAHRRWNPWTKPSPKDLNSMRLCSRLVLSGVRVAFFCLGIVQWHRKIQHCNQWNHDALLKRCTVLVGLENSSWVYPGVSQTTGYISPWWNPRKHHPKTRSTTGRKWRLSTSQSISVFSLPSIIEFLYIWNSQLHGFATKRTTNIRNDQNQSLQRFSRSILDCIPTSGGSSGASRFVSMLPLGVTIPSPSCISIHIHIHTPLKTNGWIPKMMVCKMYYPFKYGHFWYLC